MATAELAPAAAAALSDCLLIQGNALRIPLPDRSVDLVFGSPPYCDARTYGIDAQRGCAEWVEWMLAVTAEAVRVSRGLVLWVCAGVTRDHCYWPACEGLLWEWWRRGGHCWRPAYWHRVGIPGSGGKKWLRADVEYVLCFKAPGVDFWTDNVAMGHPPKWAPGGEMSHRLSDGARVNQWGGREMGCSQRQPNGTRQKPGRPSHAVVTRPREGMHSQESTNYTPPTKANPGNLIKTTVGGGQMGSKLAHENEAPFPEALAEFFVRSFCPPGGIVLDPFSGSGTTAAVAIRHDRRAIGLDLRRSQCDLAARRIAEGSRPAPRRKKSRAAAAASAGAERTPLLPLFDGADPR